jgi:hypothetical protein
MAKQEERCPEALYDIVLSVLGYHEDDKWVALALEMDLRGYGDTFQQASKELCDLVAMQISFAIFKGQPEMIFKSAERKYFHIYEKIRSRRIMQIMQPQYEEESDFEIRGLPISPDLIADHMKKNQTYAQTT